MKTRPKRKRNQYQRKRNHNPTQAEIAAATAKIREGWSRWQEYQHRVVKPKPVEISRVKMGEVA